MIKEFVLGGAVALCVAGQASALTVTLLEDGRFTEAQASAGENSDFDDDFPDPPFSAFLSKVSASAMEFGNIVDDRVGDEEFDGYGATAFAGASQKSQVTATTIQVSGSAFAEGGTGGMFPTLVRADNDSLGGPGLFEAYAESVLDIVFSIDEAAVYDLDGFISAGAELAAEADQFPGAEGGEVSNFAEMILFNEDTAEAVFEYEVSDDTMNIVESGVIGPGTYRFTASAYAEVFGGLFDDIDSAGDAETNQPFDFGDQTSARFGGIGLKLIASDKPIPEPVTTSLIGLGLGALVLQTTRRRRA
jgi:hypothetical protein